VILAWSRRCEFTQRVPLLPVVAVAGVGAGTIVASSVLWNHPIPYVVLPALVWASFVGGLRAVSAVGAAAALAADWAAITGRADGVGTGSPGQQVEVMQLLLAVMLVTGLILAVEISERRRSEQRTLEAERDRVSSEEAALQLAEAERRSITQDTHDIVGHGLNVIMLQLGAARRVLANDPDMVRELLSSSEAIGRQACEDLDVALAVVGHKQPGTTHQGLDQLPELVKVLRDAGLHVDLNVEGERNGTSTLVDWSAYRIVREALTNVLKHAPGASATATIRFDEPGLCVSVVDDGNKKDGNGSLTWQAGRGIVGMRERAAAVGGTLDVGRNPNGGFHVVALLPTRGTRLVR
jgi:signal transduction histidine kinase